MFEGDNYSQEWADEAEKRGLSNVKTTPHALDLFMTERAKALFLDNNIFTEKELEARYDTYNEKYTMKIQIEGRVLGDLCLNHVIPAAITYQNQLLENVKGLKEIGVESRGR